MAVNKSNELLARLDERTVSFQKSLDGLIQENRDGIQQVVAAVKEHAADDVRKFDLHDSRLKVLENWRWYVLGGLAVIGFLVWYLKT